VNEFLWPVRIYYEDTDNGGVVYYANYLKFMERARTEWLRTLGYEQDRLAEEQGIVFAVRSVKLEYLLPARFNDLLSVSARVTEPGKASMTFEQEVRRGDSVLCHGTIRIACIDSKTLRPVRIPSDLYGELY
jgi:acyl-CoA thioester hydrolase